MSFKSLNILSLMQRWGSKREMMGDDPPYLAVGTEVSAKYKGAFCEAKVRKIVRSVKCKIAYKVGQGSATVTDDQIKGTLRAGSVVEVKHPERKEHLEATIIKIQDCSQYTVVFDDGDITTLRRSALCLKSGRHFAESETLDQLPLTHPEHFGNPVVSGRRGRRNRNDDSSDDEGSVKKTKQPKEEKEADIGKVVCVEISDKKKLKDNWFPGLVVAPTAQDTVKINVKEDYLVRSFKDGRYYTVPKKEATAFTREIGLKVDNNNLRTAVEKALLFMDKDELPPHWDRELLFGLTEMTDTDSDAFDSDTSDDEPGEEKDHFVAQLYKFMDDRGTPINQGPTINGRDVDLYKLFKVVHKLGGYNRVTNHNQWKTVSHKLAFGQNPTSINLVKHAYKKFLHSFEDFYRKLGCTMVNHPRGQRQRQRSNRSLIRDKDKAVATKEKQTEKEAEENKDGVSVETSREKDNCATREEQKSKEAIVEIPKSSRESRKDSQRPRCEKLEKKDDPKTLPSTSKNNEPVPLKIVRDEKVKLDDREERIKLRDIVKLDSNVKEDPKVDNAIMKQSKDSKVEECQRLAKSTRRDIKEIKKDEKDDKGKLLSSEREIRHKKPLTSNAVDSQSGTEESKVKKRSLFSKITGSKRIKPMTDSNKIPRANKPLGLNSVRQKRTFSERMKAMVKKFKMKTGGKHLKQKPPSACSNKDNEDKKKSNNEENKAAVPQLTRSKSREEFSCKLRKLEVAKAATQHTNSDKKHTLTKRRKDEDRASGTMNDEPLDILPNYKTVAVGDKLKVCYGPRLESKVTYEAKVLSLKEEDNETLFLVHYTGWNTRYDEWIKRGRIADNLSWTPGRAKRTRHQQAQQSQQKPLLKRSKSGGDAGVGMAPRSSTPSSVTSSSSRTKSPGVSNPLRNGRSQTRSRRTSGHTHTDFSESELDDGFESDDTDGVQGSNCKYGSVEQKLSSDERDTKDDTKENLTERVRSKTYRPAFRRRMESGCETDEVAMEHKKIKDESEEEGKCEKIKRKYEKRKPEEGSASTNDDVKKDVSDVHRSDRLRNKRRAAAEANDSSDEKESKLEIRSEESKIEKAVDSGKCKIECEKLDTEIIESELKGKLKRKSDDLGEDSKESPSNERRRSKRVTPRKEDSKLKVDDELQKESNLDLNQSCSELKRGSTTNTNVIEVITLSDKEEEYSSGNVDLDDVSVDEVNIEPTTTTLDDIYEFKEPEPFEFEVRSKCGDDRCGKIQRRSFGRVCEEMDLPSNVSIRKSPIKIKSEPPILIDPKDDIKTIGKESDENDNKEPPELKGITVQSPIDDENSTYGFCEDQAKVTTNTDENPSKRSCEDNTKEIFQPLPLFIEEDEEQEADEDNGDRLVISEPETETESRGPLFSHQQRDHEDFFPTSIDQSLSNDSSQNKTLVSENTAVIQIEENEAKVIVEPEPSRNEHVNNEAEDEKIFSAIQSELSQSAEDEDSNDMDLLTDLPDPTLKMDEGTSSGCESEVSNESQFDEINEAQILLKPGQSVPSDDSDAGEDSSKTVEEVNVDSHNSDTDIAEDKELLEIEPESSSCSSSHEEENNKVIEPQELVDEIAAIKEEAIGVVFEEKKLNKENEELCLVMEEFVKENQSNISLHIDQVVLKEDVKEKIENMNSDENIIIDPTEIKNHKVKCESSPTNKCDVIENVCTTEEIVELSLASTKVAQINEEPSEAEEGDTNLESLLCEETIPGSPAPSSSAPVEPPPLSSSPELPFASAPRAQLTVYKAPQLAVALPPPLPPPPTPLPLAEAGPVMENTPPTTPESSLSPISNSPRGERSGLSPVPDNESPKSNRDSCEDVLLPLNTKLCNYNEEEVNCDVATANVTVKKLGQHEETEPHGIRKRRRSHKKSEDNTKKVKLSHRSPRHSNVGSDSEDDASENSLDLLSLHSRSPRPSKYNFFVQLDPELDASQRIAVLQQKLTDLRKTYMSVKAELAGIDRRRKKLRRRERDLGKSHVKTEVPCS